MPPSSSGGSQSGRRRVLPVLLAGATIIVMFFVAALNEGRDLQAGYLRSISIPHQYVSYRPGIFARSPPTLASCPPSPSSEWYNFSKDPRPPSLVSYPGSGSTLTRLLLEMATHIHTGSVYGDISLYNNSGHQFLGEFNTANVSVVKTHFPVGPTHGPEFEYRAATRAVILLRDPRRAIPSYLNYQYGDSIGSKHDVQAPLRVWKEWRDEPGRVETELQKWINITRHWAERLDDLHIVLYEDVIGSRASGVEALRSLIQFLDLGKDMSDDAIACVWEEILGKKAQGKGIRRSKKYIPAYTAEQHSMITSELEAFADSIDDNGISERSSLIEAIRLYSAKVIPANDMAEEREMI
mmetsp:Transcript_16865/g.48462  ORF Transcript_16865/g.48462 Transcript_16865/m.48462 type:complete len:353 (-) Transcript_16865:115-1173(-)